MIFSSCQPTISETEMEKCCTKVGSTLLFVRNSMSLPILWLLGGNHFICQQMFICRDPKIEYGLHLAMTNYSLLGY